jgi:hypothetical protein
MSENFEIKYISEKEMWVGGNKTFLTDQNIIHCVSIGEQTTEIALLQKEIVYKLFEWAKGKTNFLIDLNNCGKSSPEAREIWKQLSEDERTNKVAVFGINPVARVLANFVIGTSKSNNLRFFKTQEEAMLWFL